MNSNKRLVITLSIIIIILIGTIIVLLTTKTTKIISNFEQCKSADGQILETYPEQCLINGTTFTSNPDNSSQPPTSSNEYIGLTEAEALAKAKQNNTAARVVERNGEQLPATMDFSFGRHNLYIKDGKVYKVEIEGQASDLPLR